MGKTVLELGQTNISETIFQLSNADIVIDTYYCAFPSWNGIIDFDTYGGKTILDWNGASVFAELYVLKQLEQLGFTGAWIDTYGGKFWNELPAYSKPLSQLPSQLQDIYNKIKENNGQKRKGCWDVLVQKNDHVLFAELKRSKKDAIRQSQVDWLSAAFDAGLTKENFIVVEWDVAI